MYYCNFDNLYYKDDAKKIMLQKSLFNFEKSSRFANSANLNKHYYLLTIKKKIAMTFLD